MLLQNTQVTNEIASMFTQNDVSKLVSQWVANISKVDSYKFEHWITLNKKNDFANGYIAPRKGKPVLVAGILSAVVEIFDFTVTEQMVNVMEKYQKAMVRGMEFNRNGWMSIVNDLNGKLPLEITGLPEGSIADTHCPIVTIRNTLPGYTWLVTYYLDAILRIWKATDIATDCIEMKAALYKAARDTGSTHEEAIEWVEVAINDFGVRSAGATGHEAASAGIGHLTVFKGGDNAESNWRFLMLYGTESDWENMNLRCGSVFALEHNCLLSYGKDLEHEFLLEYITKLLLDGRICSMLIDTWDIDACVQFICDNLDVIREAWEKGGSTGKLVLRPDSGDEVDVPISVAKSLVKALDLDVTSNDEYIRLPSWLGVIQGDGINKAMIDRFASAVKFHKLSMTIFVMGIGGSLLNGNKRDDRSWSGKMNAVERNGEVIGTSKNPTGAAGKRTLHGYHSVELVDGIYKAVPVSSYKEVKMPDCYFKEGNIKQDSTYDSLDKEVNESLMKFIKMAA